MNTSSHISSTSLWHTSFEVYQVTLTSGCGQRVTEVFVDEPSAVYFVWNFLVHGADFNHYGVYQTTTQHDAMPSADAYASMTRAECIQWFETEMHRRLHIEATVEDTVNWLPAPSTLEQLDIQLSALAASKKTRRMAALDYVVDCEPYERNQWGYHITKSPVRTLKRT